MRETRFDCVHLCRLSNNIPLEQISKKRASEAMLEQLKSLNSESVPVISPGPRVKKKNTRKKKPKNLIKVRLSPR